MMAASCLDARRERFSCDDVNGAATYLCHGLALIYAASCSDLGDAAFLESVIQRIGLVPDWREGGTYLYGNQSIFMANSSGGKAGVWQAPLQLSSSLVHLSNTIEQPGRAPTLFRYVEVGVFTGWTCAVVAAFMIRMVGRGHFVGAAVDVTKMRISRATLGLLERLDVTFVYRGNLPGWIKEQSTRQVGFQNRSAILDLCFIDGEHRFDAVRADYDSLARHCRFIMLHDIVDVRTIELQKRQGGGGVASMWHALVSSVHPSRLATFTMQPHGVLASAFGIGIVSPHNGTGTAEPDDVEALERWGRGQAAWRSLCVSMPSVCARSWLSDWAQAARGQRSGPQPDGLAQAFASITEAMRKRRLVAEEEDQVEGLDHVSAVRASSGDICTACVDRRCSLVRYSGRGRLERSTPVANAVGRAAVRTWHAFAQPSSVDFFDGIACTAPHELRSHSIVPVTHTRSGYAIGLWLYYARGCSDFGWDVGRTLLASNRVALAFALARTLRSGGILTRLWRSGLSRSRSGLSHGQPKKPEEEEGESVQEQHRTARHEQQAKYPGSYQFSLTKASSANVHDEQHSVATAAVHDVVQLLQAHHPGWARLVLSRALNSSHAHVRRYLKSDHHAEMAGMRSSVDPGGPRQTQRAVESSGGGARRQGEAAARNGTGRSVPSAPQIVTLTTLLLDAARGLVSPRASLDELCHVEGDVGPNATFRRCSGLCARRARALAYIFSGDATALDRLNAGLIRQLCATPLQLDTAILTQQPQGRGSMRWATEIWDVRSLCTRSGTSATEPYYRWLNGSRCTPSPHKEWKACMACDGSWLRRIGCAPRASHINTAVP